MTKRPRPGFLALAGMLLCLTSAGPSLASDPVNLRVVYTDGPAANAIQAGRLSEAIAYLEEQVAKSADLPTDELGSLCAAYVLDRKFTAAKTACDHAVESDGTALAYNNRGVLRAHLGDIDGSIEDFSRIRVLQDEFAAYVRRLTEGNARLMATNNFEMVKRLRATVDAADISLTSRPSGADVEDPVSRH